MSRHRLTLRLRFDSDAIRAGNPIEGEVGRHVALKPDGGEFIGLCPFHNEKTPSFRVVTAAADKRGRYGFFHCFGCGVNGDVIDFVCRIYNAEFRQACEILGGSSRSTSSPTFAPAKAAQDPYADLVAVPPPARPVVAGEWLELWNPKGLLKSPQRPVWRCRPSAVYPYRDAAQNVLGYVLRIDMPDGKLTPAIRYARRADGTTQWTSWHFAKPRPIYRIEHLCRASETPPILVCEGEKASDAAAELLGALAVTWPGGGKAIQYADWSALRGRDLYLWPDADQEGEHAMTGKPADGAVPAKPGVAQLATAAGAKIKAVIEWDRSRPKGWDAADALHDGWSRSDTITWMNQQAHTWNP